EESRREFKNGLITFSIIAVVIITIGFFLGG
ncbi:MAG: hypothetical protein K0R18_1255, partial [Bacillales bacterium]|nr:hypothetical protein [Bacillales bacterium]